MRYVFMKFLDALLFRHVERCIYCGKALTTIEEYYYVCACHRCESKINEELDV